MEYGPPWVQFLWRGFVYGTTGPYSIGNMDPGFIYIGGIFYMTPANDCQWLDHQSLDQSMTANLFFMVSRLRV